jgi:hypothetical protein
MPSFTTYKNLEILDATPTEAGGQALNDNFTYIADELDSLGTAAFLNTGTGSGNVVALNNDGNIEGFSLLVRTETNADMAEIVLEEGELGFTTDTHDPRIGDGSTEGGINILTGYKRGVFAASTSGTGPFGASINCNAGDIATISLGSGITIDFITGTPTNYQLLMIAAYNSASGSISLTWHANADVEASNEVALPTGIAALTETRVLLQYSARESVWHAIAAVTI